MTYLGSMLSTLCDIILFSMIAKDNLFNIIKKRGLFLLFITFIIGNFSVITQFYPLSKFLIPFINLFSISIFLIYLNIYFQHSFKTSLIASLQFCLCSFISELLAGSLFTFLLKENVAFVGYYNNLFFVLIVALIKLFFVLIIKTSTHNFDALTRSELLMVLINMLSSLFILAIYICSIFVFNTQFSPSSYFLFFSLSVFGIISGTFIQLAIMKRLQKQKLEKEIIKNEVNTYKTVIKNNTEAQKTFESIFHDFKNSVILIDKYVRNEEKDKALAYIQQFQSEITYIQERRLHTYTAHEELNYLLIAKKLYANSQNITMKIDCFLIDQALISNDIIIVILGNLIDNAINACINDNYSQDKYIHLKIKQIDNHLYILINNSIAPNITEESLSEGTGIKNIKKFVNKNGGFYSREIENQNYSVKIILWSKDNKLYNF